MYENFKQIRINGTAQRLFSVLKDAEKWPVWDVDLKTVALSNPESAKASIEGATGKLTMNNGRSFDFTIHNVIENRFVSYETKLPGATADWYWAFNEVENNAIDLKMGVKFTGPATFVYRLLLGGMLGPAFNTCTMNLKELVEKGTVGGVAHTVGI